MGQLGRFRAKFDPSFLPDYILTFCLFCTATGVVLLCSFLFFSLSLFPSSRQVQDKLPMMADLVVGQGFKTLAIQSPTHMALEPTPTS